MSSSSLEGIGKATFVASDLFVVPRRNPHPEIVLLAVRYASTTDAAMQFPVWMLN